MMRLSNVELKPLQSPVRDIVLLLKNQIDDLSLTEAEIYFDFPLYKDIVGDTVISDITIVSEYHGVIVLSCSASTLFEEIKEHEKITEDVYTSIYSKLLRNPVIKLGMRDIAIPLSGAIYTPNYDSNIVSNLHNVKSDLSVLDFFRSISQDVPISNEILNETRATLEGSKGLPKKGDRVSIGDEKTKTKGFIADKIEGQLALFDQEQKLAYQSIITGPERIRGLAGSGKTVILAMKAAITHLRHPEKKIVYTFWTKSLYQHVINTITRFYRQFDDKDPNWNNLIVVHAWGGDLPGLYSILAESVGTRPLTFTEARRLAPPKRDPFAYAVNQLRSKLANDRFDYIFIDEGQDFDASFIGFCASITKDKKICWGYDELQTIFMPIAPSAAAVGLDLTRDIVLKKCYRNPRDVLVAAHAVGFGIYGSRITQMLENRDHWIDLGYEIVKGDFTSGSETVIHRPLENSPSLITELQPKNEIMSVSNFEKFDDEIEYICSSIADDIEKGLRAKDILVISVDDRNARTYLSRIGEKLTEYGISSRNRHSQYFSKDNFFEDFNVTLTTVHKAKGNEAYMVYVVGCDAPFSGFIGSKERNILFTALTRTKGWVRASGVGISAEIFTKEVNQALSISPELTFNYPLPKDLRIMKRDLEAGDVDRAKREQALRKLLAEMTKEEIITYLGREGIIKD